MARMVSDLPAAVQWIVRRRIDFAVDHSLALPIGVAIALVWANTFDVSWWRR